MTINLENHLHITRSLIQKEPNQETRQPFSKIDKNPTKKTRNNNIQKTRNKIRTMIRNTK